MGDQALKSDVQDNLGLAATELANPSVRSICSGRGFEDALATENRFAEKMSLFHLGLAYSAMRELNHGKIPNRTRSAVWIPGGALHAVKATGALECSRN